jgi:integrative and conjugative element protein (TIGR02256 family)
VTIWKGKTEDGTFAVEFQASVLSALDQYCRDAKSSETGGILIGRYSEDLSLAIVREATPPPMDSRRGRAWFVRGIHGLRDMLSKRWRAAERTYYVGEWHFHPASHIEPSNDDFEQMLKISRSKKYECKEPLLLILGAGEVEGQRIFRAYVCPVNESPLEILADETVY